ncbi:hypothetical protein [Novosphingobium sp.]|uniref:hypothetical protein n=1 Tax=Novosphingobium sp. TaxID=1874826 RepID=UPI003D6D06BA
MFEIKATAAPDAPASASPFTPLQWLVIAMGSRPGSLPLACSPFGQALVGLVGGDEPEGPCLETLRHTARIAGRCGWGIPSAEVGRFLMAGWSEDQLEALIESVSDPRPCETERRTFDNGDGALLGHPRFALGTNIMEMPI